MQVKDRNWKTHKSDDIPPHYFRGIDRLRLLVNHEKQIDLQNFTTARDKAKENIVFQFPQNVDSGRNLTLTGTKVTSSDLHRYSETFFLARGRVVNSKEGKVLLSPETVLEAERSRQYKRIDTTESSTCITEITTIDSDFNLQQLKPRIEILLQTQTRNIRDKSAGTTYYYPGNEPDELLRYIKPKETLIKDIGTTEEKHPARALLKKKVRGICVIPVMFEPDNSSTVFAYQVTLSPKPITDEQYELLRADAERIEENIRGGNTKTTKGPFQVYDVSVRGLRMSMPDAGLMRDMQSMSSVGLNLQFQGQRRSYRIYGSIVWSREHGGGFMAGFRFGTISDIHTGPGHFEKGRLALIEAIEFFIERNKK